MTKKHFLSLTASKIRIKLWENFWSIFHLPFAESPYVLETVSHLLQRGIMRELVDFDNYLDDLSQDWTNLGIEKLIASINASNTIDCKEDEKLFR